MDHARKLGKVDDPYKWIKGNAPKVSASDGLCRVDPPLHEDRRLKNWKKWLNDRQRQHRHLKAVTGREPVDQTLHSGERVRSLVEMRTLTDYANQQIPILPDKYRGGPEFWRTPELLPDHGDSCLKPLALTPTRKEMNVAPEILRVGMPPYIEMEKGLSGISERLSPWEQSPYLIDRKDELSDQVKLLLPKEPETDDLIIQGQTLRKKVKSKNVLRAPPITIHSPEDLGDFPPKDPDISIVLKIEDKEVIWNRSLFEEGCTRVEPIIWKFLFTGTVNRRMERTITFENRGSRVILYYWRDATFRLKDVQKRPSPFYFNKTKGIILPGQIVELKVWYLPREANYEFEVWKLITDPPLTPASLIFEFHSCAQASTSPVPRRHDTQAVEDYLESRVRDTVVRTLIDEIFSKVNYVLPSKPAYGTLFLEREIFVSKNPIYYYNPDLIVEFRKLYSEVRNPDEPEWNLSLVDFKDRLLSIKPAARRNKLFDMFEKICELSLRPNVCQIVKNDKYQMINNILCSFVNTFESESDYVVSSCFFKEEHNANLDTTDTKSVNVSIISVRSSISRRKGKRLSTRSGGGVSGPSEQRRESLQNALSERQYQIYRELFYVRMYQALGDTIQRVSGIIDSVNRLNNGDK